MKVSAAQLKRLRQAQGLSIRKLADRAGMTSAHLSNIERGLANPRDLKVKGLAQALGVSVEAIVEPASPHSPVARSNRTPVRGSIRYLLVYGPDRPNAPGEPNRNFIRVSVVYSYDIYNPSDETMPYTIASFLEPEYTALFGDEAARFISVSAWDPEGQYGKRYGADELLANDRVSAPSDKRKDLVLDLPGGVPGRATRFIQVECEQIFGEADHTTWEVTYPTNRMSLLVRHPHDLAITVGPRYPSPENPRIVMDYPDMKWWEISHYLEEYQGVYLSWEPVRGRGTPAGIGSPVSSGRRLRRSNPD